MEKSGFRDRPPDRKCYALTPRPQIGDLIDLTNAIPLNAREGGHLSKLLGILADSEDGMTADKANLMAAFGYCQKSVIGRGRQMKTGQANFDEGIKEKLKIAKTKLYNEMHNLKRMMHERFPSNDKTPVWDEVSTDSAIVYKTAFVTRFIKPAGANRFRFGEPG